MKKISIILYIVTVFCLVWACKEKDNLDPLGNWTISAPVLSTPSDNSNLVLNENAPDEIIQFTWEKATTSSNYQVKYFLVLDSANSTDFSTPIYKISADNNGKSLIATLKSKDVDEALSYAGYNAGQEVSLTWAVIAQSLDKEIITSRDISIKRFATETLPIQLFISGTATEKGSDLSQAIPMRSLLNANGQPTYIFELYTSLKAGKTYNFYSKTVSPSLKYGGTGGNLTKNGAAIIASADGQYRITVNLNNNSYSLLKIDKWSVVGGNIPGGWGGDEPLSYKGNSLWEGSINLVSSGGFIFRANGDWAYLLKRIKGTTNHLVMESQASGQGKEYEDIPSDGTGKYIFTLNLAANQYTYTLTKDASITAPGSTPAKLYLLSGGSVVAELTKSGNKFESSVYLALQKNQIYTLNSSQDGTGQSYILDDKIGKTDNPGADAVNKVAIFGEGTGNVEIERDQAYKLTFDFATGQLSWKYYNIKLFHWVESAGGWDARDEFLMTYEHPYTYKITASLKASSDLKFISPWDIEMGADNPAALSGSMTRGGGSNFKNISSDGTYQVSIQLSPNYQTGTYQFVKQ